MGMQSSVVQGMLKPPCFLPGGASRLGLIVLCRQTLLCGKVSHRTGLKLEGVRLPLGPMSGKAYPIYPTQLPSVVGRC
jgi:hypothetical protein